MTIDLDDLEAKARAATRGPWTSEDGCYEPPKPSDDFPGRVGYDDMANVYGAPVEVSAREQLVPRLAYPAEQR